MADGMRFRLTTLMACLALAIVTTACSTTNVRTTPPPVDAHIADPLEPFNRASFAVNDGLDAVVIGPVSSVYRTVVPSPARDGVNNVLSNLSTPVWMINEMLQGDFADAHIAFDRFLLNSTLGVGGIFDVASREGLERQSEDFGQTLGAHGVGSGVYLVLPILGPTTSRDVIGTAGDFAMSPLRVLDVNNGARQGVRAVGGIDQRTRAASFLTRLESSADPYIALRSLYAQMRAADIHEDADPYEDLPEFE